MPVSYKETTGRKPAFVLRFSGSFLLRLAVRQLRALLFQEPPRKTRAEPSDGYPLSCHFLALIIFRGNFKKISTAERSRFPNSRPLVAQVAFRSALAPLHCHLHHKLAYFDPPSLFQVKIGLFLLTGNSWNLGP